MSAQAAALQGALERIAAGYAPAALASSLSAEDMVLTDAILRNGLQLEIFTLDTGRLHGDTLALLEAIRERYGRSVRVFRPDPEAVRAYEADFGRDAIYSGVALRKRCCEIRKVEPLSRALAGKRAWISGQRRGHSSTRAALPAREYDRAHGLEKFNPLADWRTADVWAYLREHGVPFNALYGHGYRSIGCAPCTRPVTPQEDERAGRWWWERPETRECGLHVDPEGRLVRAAAAAGVTA